MICKTCGKNEAINDYYQECQGCIEAHQRKAIYEVSKQTCYRCIHFGVCEMSNEMSRFIDGKIKEYPAIYNDVFQLIHKLALYCREYKRDKK